MLKCVLRSHKYCYRKYAIFVTYAKSNAIAIRNKQQHRDDGLGVGGEEDDEEQE